MPSEPQQIHRRSEVTRLSELLKNPPERVSISAISGPGGVGKTFLLNHVLETVGIEQLGYLRLSADGSAPYARGDFFGVLEGQLFRRSLPPPADPSRDYFPRIREVAALHRALVDDATTELDKRGAPPDVKRAAVALLKAGHILNKAIPLTREYLDVAGQNISEKQVADSLDDAWSLLGSLRALRDSTLLWGPLRDLVGVTRRNRVKRELHALTAAELRVDLSAAIVGYEKRDTGKITQAKIPGVERLLVVLDDYEVLGPVLGDFLIGALVPALAAAPFKTVLVVLGRDELEVTHPGWAQHCKRWLREPIRLHPFDRAAALELLEAAGIAPERREAMFEATQGYPFLLELLVEEANTGGDSALFLRRFFDRTTRWMTPTEREWFTLVCYLDRIDEDTLGLLFPKNEVVQVQDWFEREPSVRDPSSRRFQVRALIRDKVLQYQEIRAPSRHRELLERVAPTRST